MYERKSRKEYIRIGKLGAEVRWAKEPPFEIRFWKRVDVRGPDECWPWKLSLLKTGYGKTKFHGIHIGAHRLAYIVTYGEIPKGLHVCHHCDNRRCCNPKHLFIGTPSDNVNDAVKKGRWNPPRGEMQTVRKLDTKDVLAIRKCVADGEAQCQVARRYGITHGTVNSIYHRRSWKHV